MYPNVVRHVVSDRDVWAFLPHIGTIMTNRVSIVKKEGAGRELYEQRIAHFMKVVNGNGGDL